LLSHFFLTALAFPKDYPELFQFFFIEEAEQ